MDSPLDTQGSEPQFNYIQMIKINFKRSIFKQLHFEKKMSEKQKAWNANHNKCMNEKYRIADLNNT